MRIRTGVAALALAGCAFFAAGCKGDGTAGSASSGGAAPAKAANATEELLAGADSLRTKSYKFSVTSSGVTSGGAVDPATKTITMDGTMGVKVLVIDGQFYLKYPKNMPGAEAFGGGGDKWMHLDSSKVAAGKLGLQDATDPSGAYNYIKSAASVQKVSDKHYKGTLDLTKVPAMAKLLPGMGDSAKAVPFEATLDDKGRMSTVDTTVKVNGVDATSHMVYSDYGTTVTATKPAASEVVEAPDSIYQIFGK
jgi:hypothetical protein